MNFNSLLKPQFHLCTFNRQVTYQHPHQWKRKNNQPLLDSVPGASKHTISFNPYNGSLR